MASQGPSKKRKLNDGEISKNKDESLQNAIQLLLDSEIEDIVAEMSYFDENQLSKLWRKFELLREESAVLFMESIRFDVWNDIMSHEERQRKLKQCIRHNDSEYGDIQRNYDYCREKHFASFSVGPKHLELEFNCNIGSDEGNMDGSISLGSLWKVDFDKSRYSDAELEIDTEAIKRFIEDCGIKGVSTELSEGMPCYGLHVFLYDLTCVCFEIFCNRWTQRKRQPWELDIDVSDHSEVLQGCVTDESKTIRCFN